MGFSQNEQAFQQDKKVMGSFFSIWQAREAWTRVASHGESFFPMHSRNYEIGVCVYFFFPNQEKEWLEIFSSCSWMSVDIGPLSWRFYKQVQKQDYFTYYFVGKHFISRILLQVGRIIPVCRPSFPLFFLFSFQHLRICQKRNLLLSFSSSRFISRILLQVGRILPVCRPSFPRFFLLFSFQHFRIFQKRNLLKSFSSSHVLLLLKNKKVEALKLQENERNHLQWLGGVKSKCTILISQQI